jgi:hypothetical protein
MRFFLLLLLSCALPRLSVAQVAISYSAAESKGIRVSHLDSVYRSAVHADTAKAVFAGHEDEVAQAYGKLLQSLGIYLKAHQFAWGKPTKSFNRIYFRPDGTIDYYIFKFRAGEIEAVREAEFQRLLAEFVKTHKIDLRGRMPFAQCSPVTYQDATAAK